MKLLAAIIVGILGVTDVDAQTSWRQLSVPTSRNLKRVCFLDSLTGWVAGDSGTILKTTTGGESWTAQSSGTSGDVADLFMLNGTRGWAIANSISLDSAGTCLLRTTDGGDHWERNLYPDRDKWFLSIYFLDSLTGWMAGIFGEVVGTTNGGTEWFPATIDSASTHLYWNLFRVRFISPQRGFAVGGQYDMCGVIWRTTNGGASWFNNVLGPEPICDLAFIDSLNGIAVGGDNEFGVGMLRTTDGGSTWDFRWLNLFGQATAISFRTQTEAWAPLGFASRYMHTADTGGTWIVESPPAPIFRSLNDVQFTDRKTGYMVGDAGVVMKYNYVECNVDIALGWNMISNPVTVEDDTVLHLYPTSMNPHAFCFVPNGPLAGYQKDTTMENGKGYWEKFPGAIVQPIVGLPRTLDSISVVGGWNIVGTISSPVDTASIVEVPSGLKLSHWFDFSPAIGYQPATPLVPGKAYWVKANTPGGKLVFSAGPLSAKSAPRGNDPLSALNSLTVSDSRGGSQMLYFGAVGESAIGLAMYDMPPVPPTGAFDARFETADGGSMVRTHGVKAAEDVEFSVAVQSEAYPLTITWNTNKGTASYELTDGVGGRAFTTTAMNGQGGITMRNTRVRKFVIRVVGDGQLPKEFALRQNYPNPFNPSTTIKYDLPVDARVSLKVFNIIGQEVVTLVNEVQKAGYKSVRFDASNLASGTHFYRLQAGSFTSVKKMLVLK